MKRYELRKQREKLKYTQQEVADKACISRSFYTRIESGGEDPSPQTAYAISTVLDADLQRIFPEVVEKYKDIFLILNVRLANEKAS